MFNNLLNEEPLIQCTYMYITRQVTRAKSKSGAVVKHQRMFVVLKTQKKSLFKSGAAPLYHSLVTSLIA